MCKIVNKNEYSFEGSVIINGNSETIKIIFINSGDENLEIREDIKNVTISKGTDINDDIWDKSIEKIKYQGFKISSIIECKYPDGKCRTQQIEFGR